MLVVRRPKAFLALSVLFVFGARPLKCLLFGPSLGHAVLHLRSSVYHSTCQVPKAEKVLGSIQC